MVCLLAIPEKKNGKNPVSLAQENASSSPNANLFLRLLIKPELFIGSGFFIYRGNFKSPAKFDWKKIVEEMEMVV